jgi:hypothetical protein
MNIAQEPVGSLDLVFGVRISRPMPAQLSQRKLGAVK